MFNHVYIYVRFLSKYCKEYNRIYKISELYSEKLWGILEYFYFFERKISY